MINKSNLKHLGVIVDGNRRYANKIGLSGINIHSSGAKKVEELLDWVMNDTQIEIVSIYCLSIENIENRSKLELLYIKKLLSEYIEKLKNHSFYNRCRVNIIGDINILDSDILIEETKKLTEETKNNLPYTLNLLIGYGGRQEILRAINLIVKNNSNSEDPITEDILRGYLYTQNQIDPDLIIRTGGDIRISNFLLFQSAYSEWHFTSTLWPEFTKEEFFYIINQYYNRERRFGK